MAQILFGRNTAGGVVQDDLPVFARQQPYCVTQINQAEDAFEQVVAVGPAADDAQVEIELGRGEKGKGGRVRLHHTACPA